MVDGQHYTTFRILVVVLGIGPDKLVVNIGNCCVNEIVVSSPFVVGSWTNVAFAFDYGLGKFALYANGIEVGTFTGGRTVPTQALDFGGHRSDFGQNFYWNGLQDNIQVYNRVLTGAEIQQLATLPSAVPEPSATLLLVMALGGIVCYRWRRHRRRG